MNDEAVPDRARGTVSPLIADLTAAETLDDTVDILVSVLEGESDSTLLPHAYISESYKKLPRSVREDVDQSMVRLLDAVANRSVLNDDGAIELLLLAKSIFASRELAQPALAPIARILLNVEDYPAEVAVAAGQAAIGLGYYGGYELWDKLYRVAGDHAAPTVVTGLARADWDGLIRWLGRRKNDAWIERTVINHMQGFLIIRGPEALRALLTSIWPATSDRGRAELRAFAERTGVNFEPSETSAAAPGANWPLILRGILSDELTRHVTEAGGVEAYIRKLFIGRGEDAQQQFDDALEAEVKDWTDAHAASEHYLDTILDLIAAFRPGRGSSKVVELLEKGGDVVSDSIALKALDTLWRYFEEPAARKSRVYARYKRALHALTARDTVGAVALGHLLALNAVDTSDAAFRALVARDEAKQQQVIDFAVAADWNDELLSWLFTGAIETSSADDPAAFKRFIQQIKRCAGAGFKSFWTNIEISAEKKIAVPRNLQTKYLALFQVVFVHNGLLEYESVTEN